MKNRNSSIEILKIIAIVLIVLSHSVPVYGEVGTYYCLNLGNATRDVTELILNIIRCCGQIGNVIFVICSAWFLLDSKTTKKEKIMNMIIDTFFISITFLVIVLTIGIKLTMKDIVRSFFPITFRNNWFVGCYIIFYAMHPLLNSILEKISQKELLKIDLTLIFLYCFMYLIIGGQTNYFNELIGFVVIYFIIAYVKKYMKKFQNNKNANIILLVSSIIVHIIVLLVTNYIGLKINVVSDKLWHWNRLVNPIYLVIGICSLNLAKSKEFKNKQINYISSLSLLVYMIHENLLFSQYVKPNFYKRVFLNGHILIWVFVEATILFLASLIIATIYKKTVQIILYKLSNKVYKTLRKGYLKLEDKLLRIV